MDVTQWKLTLEGRDDDGRVLSSFTFDDGGSIGELLGKALTASCLMDSNYSEFESIVDIVNTVYLCPNNCDHISLLFDLFERYNGDTESGIHLLARSMIKTGEMCLKYNSTPTPAPPAQQE